MDHLLSVGVERFIVNTHKQPEAFLESFPGNEWKRTPIIFRHEPVLLDTAGGLKNIEDLLTDDEAILCYNGDVISNIPLGKLLQFHEEKRPEATFVLRSSGRLLNVNINARGEICDVRNALKDPGIQSCLFAGIYAIERSILRHIEPGKVETIASTFIERITHSPGSLMGIVMDEGAWQSIDSVEEYEHLKTRADILEAD
jgi:NDP-sugar pyrophosphorylase family protein